MIPLTLLYLAVTAYGALFVAFSVFALKAVGGRAKSAQVGFGPKLRFRLRGVDFALAPIPGSSWVEIVGRGADHAYDGPGSWRGLSLARRLTATVGPWVLVGLVAVLCLGHARALTSFEHALPQLFLTLDMTALMKGFLKVAREDPFATVLGVVLAKSVALNLLPLPTLGGGAAIREIWTTIYPEAVDSKLSGPRVLLTALALLFTLSIAVRIVWGLVHAI